MGLPSALSRAPSPNFREGVGEGEGKLGLKSEKDGPYLLLRGFQKLLACLNTLAVFKRYGQLDALLQLLDAL